MPRADAGYAAGMAAMVLLAAPATAQMGSGGAAGASGSTPASAVAPGATSPEADATSAPAVAPLISPSLGSLADRDVPAVPRFLESRGPSGYTTSTGELGLLGFGQQPLVLGNRPFAIAPAIGVEVMGTNNVFQTRHDARADLVTTIAPSIAATVGTTRLIGTLTYAPSLSLYSTYTSQNALYQIGNGQLLAAVVPGLFYVDMRGAASVVPQTGGYIPGSGQVIDGRNATQTFNAQITPFLYHRFGSAATLQLGYSYQYSSQDWAAGPSHEAGILAAQSYSANRGFLVVRSGEDLGRLALQGRVDGTSFVGSGVYEDAHRFNAAVEARYAITPTIAVLGSIGYENIEYGGTDPATIEGATWSVGARLTPSPDSIIVVRYGHHDGFDSFSLNAGVALGVRTDLFATYGERLSTTLGLAQDLLDTTTFDALGNPVDSQSGAPVVFINPFLGVSTTLYRLRIGTFTLRQRWARDTFTLSGIWQDADPVSTDQGDPAAPQRGGYVTFGWGHDLTPRTSAFATVQYGRTSQNQVSSQDGNTYSAALTLMHRLSETLTASVQVAWITERYPSQSNLGFTQGVLRAALRKSF